MSEPASEVAAAAARTSEAKQRLFATLGEVQDRLSPDTIAQNMLDSAAQGALSTARSVAGAARSRPWMLAALAGAIGLFAARKQIGHAITGRRDATGTETESLTKKRAPSPRRKGS